VRRTIGHLEPGAAELERERQLTHVEAHPPAARAAHVAALERHHGPARIDAIVGRGRHEPARAEATERQHHRLELAAERGQHVDGGGHRRRQVLLLDEARVLQVAQPLRQEIGREPGHRLQEVGEPPPTQEQVAHEQQRPPLAHHVERLGHPAELMIAALAHLSPSLSDIFLDSKRFTF
jgi:hypothetical protein